MKLRRSPRTGGLLPTVPAAVLAAAAALLAGCAGPRTLPGDDQPTLAALAQREVAVPKDEKVAVTEEQAIAAYRAFLAAAPGAPQRPEAMRRLGDLAMDRADRRSAESEADAGRDYAEAIARYQDFLQAYPKDPRTDRVLYQLARAQEQGGRLEDALATLTKLVAAHPDTEHADEAHFRRGELLFATRDYKAAEGAYATVLAGGRDTPLRERALYMQGWSLFKLGRIEEALHPFFAVLDLKLGALPEDQREATELAELKALTRADRELVEDTFRVASIGLASLNGAESVAPYITGAVREAYQFRVYRQLGELYIRQERIKDAADTYAAFVRRQPLHAQAPLLQARVIEIYEKNGLPTLALQAKKDHVLRYGAASEFRRANPAGWERAQPLVRTHLADLARHHHALAQQSKAAADVQEAVRWYRELLASYPAGTASAQAAEQRFLLAELLTEDRRHDQAAVEYEQVAYGEPRIARGADAAYAALLAYAQLEKAAAAQQRPALQRQAVASARRFAGRYADDARAGSVLTHAAEQLWALGEGEQAAAVARQALALQPPPAPAQRRVAWTVIAHQAFDAAKFADAETAYAEVLALVGERDAARAEFAERQAAAIYKQGEAARSAGQARDAVAHFARIGALALPAGSAVRATAQFDAAAALVGLKDWAAAASALEAFRREHPGHALQAEVPSRLALAYLELDRKALAAAEFERVAQAVADPALARGALWQAAALYHAVAEQAGPVAVPVAAPAAAHPAQATTRAQRARQAAAVAATPAPDTPQATAMRAWDRYLQRFPQPLEPAIEARWKQVALAKLAGPAGAARTTELLQAVVAADAAGGDARSARTRTLGGQAALALTEPQLAAYRQVRLVEPLARNLKLKKARMEQLLQAYAAAAEVGVAEVTTTATYLSAALYQDFGRALIDSERPKKLSKAEREQYDVMLEEQAFPFEEKAIELHEANARRSTQGLYDEGVRQSFAALAKLKPVRWGKAERLDERLPAELKQVQAVLERAPNDAALLNQLGVLQRRAGDLAAARRAYEAALQADPAAAAPHLNLAILLDLYLGEPERAAALYQRTLELSPADAPVLDRWLAEIRARKPVVAEAAQTAQAAQAAQTASKESQR
jgi:tetratricopeptide (TPR) repeat protein